jgi:hypothetical protein
MKTVILFGIACLLTVSCSKSGMSTPGILAGNYAGTFEREKGIAKGHLANVSLSFTAASFSGISDSAKYPAICNGYYTITADTIIFQNQCVWTADFDWSLILNGRYSYKTSGDSLEIRRAYPGQMTDIYKLKKVN